MITFTLIDFLYAAVFPNPLVQNTVFIIFLRNIILPILIGLVILLFFQKDFDLKSINLKEILRLLGFDDVSRTENIWSYVFPRLEKTGSYVIITLKNDKIIYGLYASSSFSTTLKNGENGIYLEDTFESFDDFDNLTSTGFGVMIESSNILKIDIDNTCLREQT
jgi:hypothetical protein